jgi:hypothetical protein
MFLRRLSRSFRGLKISALTSEEIPYVMRTTARSARAKIIT